MYAFYFPIYWIGLVDLLKILQEELLPYFSLPNVIDGLFKIAKKLFGITIEAADGLAPVI